MFSQKLQLEENMKSREAEETIILYVNSATLQTAKLYSEETGRSVSTVL